MAEPTQSTIDAAAQVVVLAFDLADATLPTTPDLLARSSSPVVQDAVKKTLLDYASTKVKKGTGGGDSPEKLLEAIGEGVVDAAGKDVLAQIKKSREYFTSRWPNHACGTATFPLLDVNQTLGIGVPRGAGEDEFTHQRLPRERDHAGALRQSTGAQTERGLHVWQ